MRFPTSRNQVAVLAALLLIPAGALAQGEEGPSPASLTVSPEEITLTAGETAQIEATALDEDGNEVEVEFLYLPLYGQYWNLDKRTWGFNIFKVSREGEVSTRRPGEFAVMVRVVGSGPDPSARNSEAEGYLQQRIPLTILPRPVASLNVTAEGPLYAGTEITVRAEPLDDTGALVEGLEVTWMSSDDAVAMPIARPPTIERTRTRGVLTLGAPGAVTVTATAGAASAEMAVEVVPNPVAKMELTPDRSTARTGDVTHLEVTMTDAAGATLEGVPVGFSVSAMTDAMGMGGPSSGLITQDGRFVAGLPGVVALKWSSSSMGEYTAGLHRFADRLAIIDNLGMAVWAHLLGAVGFITHQSNFWPEYPLSLWELLERKDYDAAVAELARFSWRWDEWTHKVCEETEGEGPFIKAAMEEVGLAAGPPRPPARPVASRTVQP